MSMINDSSVEDVTFDISKLEGTEGSTDSTKKIINPFSYLEERENQKTSPSPHSTFSSLGASRNFGKFDAADKTFGETRYFASPGFNHSDVNLRRDAGGPNNEKSGVAEKPSPQNLDERRDTDNSDSSWIELEKSINEMLKNDMDSIDVNFTPEMQLKYLRAWYEDNFTKVVQFEHFISSLKYLIYEHLPNFLLQRDYSAGSLLTNVRRCLNRYRQSAGDMEMHLMEFNNQLAARLDLDTGQMEEHKRSVKEIIFGYQERLKCANERATNARKQTASLQAQLCEALERIQQLECQLNCTMADSKLKEQLSLKTKRNTGSKKSSYKGSELFEEIEYIDEMEQIIASGEALCCALQARLTEEHQCNERLRLSLKQNIGTVAVLESQLASALEESSHKSVLLNALTEEVIDSFENSLSAYFSSTSAKNAPSKTGGMLTAWKEQLQSAVKGKDEEVHKLDRLLVDRELKLADLRNRLREKQEKIGMLEQECVTLTNKFMLKQVDVNVKEMEVNALYENLSEMQSAVDMMRRELDQKLLVLIQLKEETEKRQREIAALEAFRTRFCGDRSSISSEFPQCIQGFANGRGNLQQSFVSSGSGKAVESFTKFNLGFPVTSTPTRRGNTFPYVSTRKSRGQSEDFKKTITVKSPSKNDPLLLNVSVLPSDSNEHLHCDILINDIPPIVGQMKASESLKPAVTLNKSLHSGLIPVAPSYDYLSSISSNRPSLPKTIGQLCVDLPSGLSPNYPSYGYSTERPLRRELFPKLGETVNKSSSNNLPSSSPAYEHSYSKSQPQKNRLGLPNIQPKRLFQDSGISSQTAKDITANYVNKKHNIIAVDSKQDTSAIQEKTETPAADSTSSGNIEQKHFFSAYTDNDPDLLVTDEYMPIRRNKKHKRKDKEMDDEIGG